MEPCGCHSNQSSHWIFMKSLCHQSFTRGMLQMRNDYVQPADFGDITGQRGWRTTDGPVSYKLPWSLWPRWAKNCELFSKGLIQREIDSKFYFHGKFWISLDTVFTLNLKTPRKPASENVVCLCRLLNILANFSSLFLHTGKQCGSRSDYS